MTAQQSMPDDPMSIDIVIVTYNSASIIAGCLDAIVQQDAPNVGVVIVDNDSADDTYAIAQAHRAEATVIDSGGNLGYAAAINIGVAESHADAILILNPDTSMRPGSIDTLRTALIEGGTGITAPKILNAAGHREPTIRRFPSVLRLLGQTVIGSRRAGKYPALGDLVVDDEIYETQATHDWCSGAVLLITRACLDHVGPWDESFFLYSEETDFAWRADKLGYKTLYVPDAVVEHIGGDSGTSARLWSILVTNRVDLVRKHRGRLHGAAFWAVSVLGELARSPRARNRAALIALVTGRKDPAVIAATTRQATIPN